MPNSSSPIGSSGVQSWHAPEHHNNAETALSTTPKQFSAAVEGMGVMEQKTLSVGNGEHGAQLLSDASKASTSIAVLDDGGFFDCEDGVSENQEDPSGPVQGKLQTGSNAPVLQKAGGEANALAREQAETAGQNQQQGICRWLSHALGNALTPAVSWLDMPPDFEAEEGDVGMGGPDAWDLLRGMVTSVFSTEESMPTEAPKPLRVAQKNAARLQELNGQIDDRLHRLDVQLKAMGAATKHLHAPVRRNAAQLGFYSNVQCFNYRVRGYLSAAVPFLGKLAGVAGVSTVAMAAAPLAGPLLVAGVTATTALTGAYAMAKSVQSLPGEATASGGDALTKTVYAELEFLLTEQQNLLAQESARTTQSLRIEGGIEMRKLHIVQLKAELAHLEQLGKPEAVAASSAPRHRVELGSGAQRTQMLDVVARTRDAFAAFFAPIGHGLASIGRFITGLPSLPGRLLDRWAAAKHEQAYMDNLLEVLGARRDNSLVGVVGAGAMVRAEGARSVLKDVEIDAQLRMGENLVRALQEEPSANFGRVLYKSARNLTGDAVSASIATARAIAWYAEAMAHAPAGTGGLASMVARHADGSMTVSDPDSKLFSFLRSVPTAYAVVAGDGPPVIRIDDHRQGMPGGMQGMEFKMVLDGKGNAQLHLSFTSTRGTPVFQPLANESEVLFSAQKALYRAESGQLTQPRPDFSHWTPDELKVRTQNTTARLKEQEALLQMERRQLEKVPDWSDPEFQPGVLSSAQPAVAGNPQRV